MTADQEKPRTQVHVSFLQRCTSHCFERSLTKVLFAVLICFLVIPFALWADEQVTNQEPVIITEEPVNEPAQENTDEDQLANPAPTSEMETLPAENSMVSDREFWLAIFVLAFGVIVIFVEYFSLRSRERVGASDVIRLYGVTLILVGILFVVVAGFDVDQIAPALGLLGTVAGYLLGKSVEKEG